MLITTAGKMASSRFILAMALSATLVHAQCYYPDGGEALRDVPCKPDAEASACCAEGYICISTGMCQFVEFAGTSRFARGSCTNQDWSSSECPNYCTDGEGEEGGGTDVTRCQGYTNRFFCPKSQNANVCKDESKALTFAEPSVLTTILAATKSVQSTQPTSTETSEATTTSSSQETTSTPKDEETSTTASTSPNETGPADKDSNSDSSPSPALLGGAIGGSIGGFILGGLGVWLIFFLRKAKKDALDRSRFVPEVENGYKDHQLSPKAEMPAESAPAELPGYSVSDRPRQD